MFVLFKSAGTESKITYEVCFLLNRFLQGTRLLLLLFRFQDEAKLDVGESLDKQMFSAIDMKGIFLPRLFRTSMLPFL